MAGGERPVFLLGRAAFAGSGLARAERQRGHKCVVFRRAALRSASAPIPNRYAVDGFLKIRAPRGDRWSRKSSSSRYAALIVAAYPMLMLAADSGSSSPKQRW